MVEAGHGAGADRIGQLVQAYRSILTGYEEIEALSRRERDGLREGAELAAVTELLRTKQERLARVRDEEERVKGAREWWKKVRRTLPAGAGRDLLSLLDAISRSVERSLELEAECRSLLQHRTQWGRSGGPEPSLAGARAGAARAYGQDTGGVR